MSRCKGQHAVNPFVKVLAGLAALLIARRISDGNGAFYETVRRSHGIPDPQIAFEIGHKSGGATLATVYGGVPPRWLTGEGPQMTWLPTGKPAWESIKATQLPRSQARNTNASK